MNKTLLKQTILELFEEVTEENSTDIRLDESFKPAYHALLKFLLKMVQKGKFRRPYDIDTSSGRMVFVTKGGKKLVINDANIGITILKTWKGRKDKNFFDYSEHDEIMKFALAG
tara:strand:+ start:49046 stop:49387 length:342 start_codon:yes stop_codon:yes gene_type:complete